MSYDLTDLMGLVLAKRAEAMHLHENEAPVFELKHLLDRHEGPPLAAGETEVLLRSVAPAEELSELDRNRATSFYFPFRDVAVFQVMAFREDGHVRLELRRFK
jgi:Tfp pilus assembly pilus retraction ATPase PilT